MISIFVFFTCSQQACYQCCLLLAIVNIILFGPISHRHNVYYQPSFCPLHSEHCSSRCKFRFSRDFIVVGKASHHVVALMVTYGAIAHAVLHLQAC